MSKDNSVQGMTLFGSLAKVHDDPDKYHAVGHDGISEQCLLPGTFMYHTIATEPERFRAYCRRNSERRPTIVRSITPRHRSPLGVVAWCALVVFIIGAVECVQTFARMVARLWGLL